MTRPFSGPNMQKLLGIAAIITIAAILWLLLYMYGNLSLTNALGESLAYTLILSFCGFLYQYIRDYLKALQAKIVMALMVQIIALSGTFAITSLMGQGVHALFASNLVLHLAFGLLCWIIIELWYYNFIKEEASEDCINVSAGASEKNDIIDHIPVKEGSQINIVRVEDLQYIQAYGDYVFLFTDTGKYLKEQTMKYFEMHLPPAFVRIHRSSIVNSSKIIRAELYGKESYNIQLKSGITLKASTTGYKLLKEKLSL
jgi:hypothetical protein